MDDDYYDAWDYYPDSRDSTRHGLGLRVEVRGFQWANPQAGNVIFWHYDITNEGTTDYDDNIIFGLYMDSGRRRLRALLRRHLRVGRRQRLLRQRSTQVSTWSTPGTSTGTAAICPATAAAPATSATPTSRPRATRSTASTTTRTASPTRRATAGPGTLIVGPGRDPRLRRPRTTTWRKFEADLRPAREPPGLPRRALVDRRRGHGLDRRAPRHRRRRRRRTRATPARATACPTAGEPNFDRTDLNESDQIGLTGFKMNRIKAGQGNPEPGRRRHPLLHRRSTNWPRAALRAVHRPDPGRALRPAARRELQHRVPVRLRSVPAQGRARPSASASRSPTARDLDELRAHGADRAADLQRELPVRRAAARCRR